MEDGQAGRHESAGSQQTWRVRVGAPQLGKLLKAHRAVPEALHALDLLLRECWTEVHRR